MDYRALDTLGEMFVLALAAIGVIAMLKLRHQLMFSVFLLLRGHDEPGGGFIAGLVAAGAFTLYLFAFGVSATKEVLRMVDPRDLIGAGLFFGMISVVPGVGVGDGHGHGINGGG